MRSSSTRIALGAFVIVSVILALRTTRSASGQPNRDTGSAGTILKVVVTGVMVHDQDQALDFYTNKLGFVKKTDIPVGPARWLTVVSPEQPDGPELLLEPMGFGPSKAYQKALFDAGIPWTLFGVDDIAATHERLTKLGVVFRTPPTPSGTVTIAVFEDTCGNLIQLVQE